MPINQTPRPGDKVKITIGINKGAEGVVANAHRDGSVTGSFEPSQLAEKLPVHPRDGKVRFWLEPGEFEIFGRRIII